MPAIPTYLPETIPAKDAKTLGKLWIKSLYVDSSNLDKGPATVTIELVVFDYDVNGNAVFSDKTRKIVVKDLFRLAAADMTIYKGVMDIYAVIMHFDYREKQKLDLQTSIPQQRQALPALRSAYDLANSQLSNFGWIRNYDNLSSQITTKQSEFDAENTKADRDAIQLQTLQDAVNTTQQAMMEIESIIMAIAPPEVPTQEQMDAQSLAQTNSMSAQNALNEYMGTTKDVDVINNLEGIIVSLQNQLSGLSVPSSEDRVSLASAESDVGTKYNAWASAVSKVEMDQRKLDDLLTY